MQTPLDVSSNCRNGATLLKTTLSLCPECLAHVQAAVYSDAGRVVHDQDVPKRTV
jgi:uncharacterized radical SAM superfamily Fe-S cluster-containing enzyme